MQAQVQWQTRVAAREDLVARHGEDPPAWLPERLARIDALRAFVADVDAELQSRHGGESWQQPLA